MVMGNKIREKITVPYKLQELYEERTKEMRRKE